jgi:hypothetical protein
MIIGEPVRSLIVDWRAGRTPRVYPTERTALETWIEQLVLNSELLDDYTRALQRECGRQFPFTHPLTDDARDAALLQGLGALEPSDLAELALNPVALYGLRDAVLEHAPEAWHGAFIREEQRIVSSIADDENRRPPVVESPAPVMAGQLGDATGATQTVEPAARWAFQIRPDECSWQFGDARKITDRIGLIEVEWHRGGYLLIGCSGFLRVGRHYALSVRWRAVDGTLRGEGVLADQLAPLRLAPVTGEGPSSGEWLEVQHTWSPPGGGGWDIEVRVSF